MANEDKSTRFQRARRRAVGAGIAVDVLLLAAGLVPALPRGMSRLTGSVPDSFVNALACVVALGLLRAIVLSPVAHRAEVATPHRYGAAAASPSVWWAAYWRRSLATVGALVTGACVVAVSRVVAGRWWWLGAAVVFGSAIAAAVTLMPRLAAASADVAPVAHGRLAARLQRLADRAGVAGLDVLEWKIAGRQSAVLVGVGDQQRVLLTTGLLETHAEEEIEVVVAHELAHLRRGDTWRSALLVAAVAAVALYAAARALTALGPALPLGTVTDSRVLSLVGLVLFAVQWAAMPVVTAQSRAHERQADRVALGWTQNPSALVRSLRRLSTAHLSEERPSLVTQAFFGSHPSVVERIEAAEAWGTSARRSGVGG